MVILRRLIGGSARTSPWYILRRVDNEMLRVPELCCLSAEEQRNKGNLSVLHIIMLRCVEEVSNFFVPIEDTTSYRWKYKCEKHPKFVST